MCICCNYFVFLLLVFVVVVAAVVPVAAVAVAVAVAVELADVAVEVADVVVFSDTPHPRISNAIFIGIDVQLNPTMAMSPRTPVMATWLRVLRVADVTWSLLGTF